jgi:hypothetical protein
MKKWLINFSILLLSTLVMVVFMEGARTLYFKDKHHIGIIANYSSKWKQKYGEGKSQLLTEGKFAFLEIRSEFEELIPELKEINAGVGNTDFFELKNENSSVNGYGSCGGMKPSLAKEMIHLKSLLFNLYDPPMIFFDKGTKISASLEKFIQKYQFTSKTLSTNEFGERITVPIIHRKKKVLIVGDSVAMGIGLADHETISSRLQQKDSLRQYINIAVSGIQHDVILCLLEEASKRYPDAIEELIYVFCDNDYEDITEEPGGAKLIVNKLRSFQEKNKVKKITMVRAPYIFSIPPLIKPSAEQYWLNNEVKKLLTESQNAGFHFIDISDLALEDAKSNESQLSFLRLFIDHVHLSPMGTMALVQKLLNI